MKREKRSKNKSGTPSPISKKQGGNNMAHEETRKVSSSGDLIETEEVLSSRNDENKLYNVLSKICDSINNLGKDTKAIRKSQDTLHTKMDNLEGKLEKCFC